MNRSHIKWLGAVVAAVLAVIILSWNLIAKPGPAAPSISPALAAPSPITVAESSPFQSPSTQPKITWSPTSVEVILSPGEGVSKDFTFASDQNLQNAVLEPVPGIAGFLSVQPNSFTSVPANQPQSVRMNFSIPATATLGTFDGTIHIRIGTQTFPQTLKVVVKVWRAYTSGGFTVNYPGDWFVRNRDGLAVFSNVQTPSPISDAALQTESFFSIRLMNTANPNLLPMERWFDQYFRDGFAVNPVSKTATTIGEHPAIRVETSEIGRQLHFYVSNGPNVIEITYGLFAQTFLDDYGAILLART